MSSSPVGDPHRRRYQKVPPETREEYEARLKRTTEEREQAEVRRAQEKAERKAFEASIREKGAQKASPTSHEVLTA